jgi:hypothetical protein
MDSADLSRIRQRMRRAYEWSRLRRAAVGFAPVLVLVSAAVVLGHDPGVVAILGCVLFLTGVGVLWYGHDVRRSVLPGVAAGLIPLVATLCAHHVGRACSFGDCCMTVCLPACGAGGLAAGVVIAWVGLRRTHGIWYWLVASGMALLTGAMGCLCVGAAGIAGLVAGYGFGVVPGLVSHRLAKAKDTGK